MKTHDNHRHPSRRSVEPWTTCSIGVPGRPSGGSQGGRPFAVRRGMAVGRRWSGRGRRRGAAASHRGANANRCSALRGEVVRPRSVVPPRGRPPAVPHTLAGNSVSGGGTEVECVVQSC